jgi:hypothetical protein
MEAIELSNPISSNSELTTTRKRGLNLLVRPNFDTRISMRELKYTDSDAINIAVSTSPGPIFRTTHDLVQLHS